jgi:hypothetical protein
MDGPEAATQLYGTLGFGQLFPTRLELPDPETQKVAVVNSGFKYPRKEHCPQSMYDAQMAYFFQCIQEDRTPVPGAAEGLTNEVVVLPASARAGNQEISHTMKASCPSRHLDARRTRASSRIDDNILAQDEPMLKQAGADFYLTVTNDLMVSWILL